MMVLPFIADSIWWRGCRSHRRVLAPKPLKISAVAKAEVSFTLPPDDVAGSIDAEVLERDRGCQSFHHTEVMAKEHQ
jgi:hypothetical protein